MKITIFTAVIATSSFFLSQFTLSETYRAEITAGYSQIESDYYQGDNYSAGLGGKVYFAPVDTSGLPLAEAAFLRKSNSISVYLSKSDYEYQDLSMDAYSRGLKVTYFIPESIFFFGAGIEKRKLTSTYYASADNSSLVEYSTGWDSRGTATLGLAPLDGLQIWSDFYSSVSPSEYWNLNAKYVKPIGGEQAFSVETRYEEDNEADINSMIVSVDYYFNRRLSVGVGGAHFMTGEDNGNPYHFRARQFITENTSIELSYMSSDYSDAWQLSGAIRF